MEEFLAKWIPIVAPLTAGGFLALYATIDFLKRRKAIKEIKEEFQNIRKEITSRYS